MLFLGLFLSIVAARAEGPGRLGIQLAPTISFAGIYTSPNNIDFASKGPALRSKIGAIYDYPFWENYTISTGLFYSTHHFNITQESLLLSETYELPYLQVPFLFKPYTSEIALDVRIYATLGIVGQIRLTSRNTERRRDQKALFISDFQRWGLAGFMGAGVEYDFSFSTSVFAGISYQPGFANIIGKQNKNIISPLVMGYSSLISIDLGAIF